MVLILFTVDVQIDERALHEVYLPHFKRALDAGCATVMSAYNKMNGAYCGENAVLLTDILRDEWGFKGFVHSDWVKGVYSVEGAAAGLDVENPEPLIWGEKLVAAVEDGRIAPAVIDRACRRILSVLYRFAAAADPLPDYPLGLVASAAHVALAQEAAEKSAVLLRNESVLPLAKDKIARLAVLGRLAAIENTGDNGSSRVRPPFVITPLAGLTEALGADCVVTGDESDLDAAAGAAALADAVIVVVGNTLVEEGEYIPGDFSLGSDRNAAPSAAQPAAIGGDRDNLSLPADQLALIDVAIASGKPVVVVIVSGSAIMVEGWHDRVGAILQTFYSGMMGGAALARLVFGDVSPSGKLPFTVARDAGDYPFFDKNADAITYDLWHGYSLFDRARVEPCYPFGHGLSYSDFAYSGLVATQESDALVVQVTVTNTGSVAADEVVQLYVGAPGIVVERQKKLLRGFARVALSPRESRTIKFAVPLADLRWRDEAGHGWQFEAGDYAVFAGGRPDRLLEINVTLLPD